MGRKRVKSLPKPEGKKTRQAQALLKKHKVVYEPFAASIEDKKKAKVLFYNELKRLSISIKLISEKTQISYLTVFYLFTPDKVLPGTTEERFPADANLNILTPVLHYVYKNNFSKITGWLAIFSGIIPYNHFLNEDDYLAVRKANLRDSFKHRFNEQDAVFRRLSKYVNHVFLLKTKIFNNPDLLVEQDDDMFLETYTDEEEAAFIDFFAFDDPLNLSNLELHGQSVKVTEQRKYGNNEKLKLLIARKDKYLQKQQQARAEIRKSRQDVLVAKVVKLIENNHLDMSFFSEGVYPPEIISAVEKKLQDRAEIAKRRRKNNN